jgi:hypothetical protein
MDVYTSLHTYSQCWSLCLAYPTRVIAAASLFLMSGLHIISIGPKTASNDRYLL